MKQLSLKECELGEAIAHVSAMKVPNEKISRVLCLLTEEMYAMVVELLDMRLLDFSIVTDEKKAVLSISVDAWINEETKQSLLAVSSSGKNAALKGVSGFFRSILEAFAIGTEAGMNEMYAYNYGVSSMGMMNSSEWMLSTYIQRAPESVVKEEWDELEKTIITRFADDITIGVYGDTLKMSITKLFSDN